METFKVGDPIRWLGFKKSPLHGGSVRSQAMAIEDYIAVTGSFPPHRGAEGIIVSLEDEGYAEVEFDGVKGNVVVHLSEVRYAETNLGIRARS